MSKKCIFLWGNSKKFSFVDCFVLVKIDKWSKIKKGFFSYRKQWKVQKKTRRRQITIFLYFFSVTTTTKDENFKIFSFIFNGKENKTEYRPKQRKAKQASLAKEKNMDWICVYYIVSSCDRFVRRLCAARTYINLKRKKMFFL